MPRRYSSDYVCKILRRHGFELVAQRGSHAKYRKPGSPTLTVIVPMGRKELKLGTFHSILRQANLSEEQFRDDRAA